MLSNSMETLYVASAIRSNVVNDVVEEFEVSDHACNEQSLYLPINMRKVAEIHDDSESLIWISKFSGKTFAHAKPYQTTFGNLESLCSLPKNRTNFDTWAFSPSVNLKSNCQSPQAIANTVLVYEFIDLPNRITSADLIQLTSKYRSFCYKTHSHRYCDWQDSYCLVIEISRPLNSNEYGIVAGNLSETFTKIVYKPSRIAASRYIDDQSFISLGHFNFPSVNISSTDESFDFSRKLGPALDCDHWLNMNGEDK